MCLDSRYTVIALANVALRLLNKCPGSSLAGYQRQSLSSTSLAEQAHSLVPHPSELPVKQWEGDALRGLFLLYNGQSEPYTPFADPHDSVGAEVRS
jgi:hypothetical protein